MKPYLNTWYQNSTYHIMIFNHQGPVGRNIYDSQKLYNVDYIVVWSHNIRVSFNVPELTIGTEKTEYITELNKRAIDMIFSGEVEFRW